MNASVIICTHNPREEYLRRVLDGLRKQTLPFHQWELLLIDNSSKVSLAGHFDLSWHPHARHVREEELGLTPARLRGIKESVAAVLVFVDDDTVLAADYLEQALNVGAAWPFIGTWGGNCVPEYEVPLPDWVGDQVWRLSVQPVREDVWGNVKEGFETKPGGAGICVRRPVGLAFAEECRKNAASKGLGRKGTSLSAYEDMVFSYCAIEMGLGNGKCSRLYLTHLIPATRLTLDYFLRHAEADAASLMIIRAFHGLPIAPPGKQTLLGSLRWWLHRVIHRVPREQYEIAKAHQRGYEKGWRLAQQYLETKK